MAELKTKKTNASVSDFVKSIEDAKVRKQCQRLLRIFKEATGCRPKMWGSSIVGYGR